MRVVESVELLQPLVAKNIGKSHGKDSRDLNAKIHE